MPPRRYFKQGNFYGGNGIVGAQVPLGVGAAFAHKYRKDGGLCVAAFGDGAANQGQIYEAANMAALWKLPAIFLVENNQYGMGTSTKRASASDQFYTRGDYIPGLWIDGMDVLAVKQGFEFAAEYVRSNGPLFIEASTYRYHGHSMSDPGISYRTRDEVDEMRAQRDPIERVKHLILKHGVATEAELKKMDKEIRHDIDQVAEFAKQSKELPYERLFTEIYKVSSHLAQHSVTSPQPSRIPHLGLASPACCCVRLKGEAPPFIRLPDFRKSVSVEGGGSKVEVQPAAQ